MRLHPPLRLGITALAVTAALGAACAVTVGATSPSPSAAASADPSAGSSPSAAPTPGACSGSVAAQLACIRQRAATAVGDRESALREMAADLDGSAAIGAGDKSTLLGQVSADESGLETLLGTIDSDTSVAQARADTETIVTGFRVYLLEGPKVHLVIAADTEGSVESVIQAHLPAVQTAIDDSAASAAQRARAQTALNDCSSQLGAAESASSGIVAEVIDLQPSGYPGNQPTLVSARQSAQTARQELGTCSTDLQDIRQDLGI
ncbi:MAG: hypothetical protein ACLQT7_04305 [Candidatus Dormibacteria bacterium]